MIEEQQRALDAFIFACNDMIRSNFILAKSKLSVVFKTIASDETLKKFFEETVDGYQFKMAKTKCFASTFDGRRLKQIVLLPSQPRERVAFLFCLLVEVTKDKIDIVVDNVSFDAFLMRFFGSEGDFEKSYAVFCEQIMIPFRNAVRDAFTHPFQYYDDPRSVEPAKVNYVSPAEQELPKSEEEVEDLARKQAFVADMIGYLQAEKSAIREIELSQRQCSIATYMLEEIEEQLQSGTLSAIKAILWGYHYLLLYCKYSSENVSGMYDCIARFEEEIS